MSQIFVSNNEICLFTLMGETLQLENTCLWEEILKIQFQWSCRLPIIGDFWLIKVSLAVNPFDATGLFV